MRKLLFMLVLWTLTNPLIAQWNKEEPKSILFYEFIPNVGGDVGITDTLFVGKTAGSWNFGIDSNGYIFKLGGIAPPNGSVLMGNGLTASFVMPTFGTVTSVASGNFSPLFNVGILNPTTTPTFSYTAISQLQNLVYASPVGSSGTPTFRALDPSDFLGFNQYELLFGGPDGYPIQSANLQFGDMLGGNILYFTGTNPLIDMRDPANSFVANYSNEVVSLTDGTGAGTQLTYDGFSIIDDDAGNVKFVKDDDNTGTNYQLTLPAQQAAAPSFWYNDGTGLLSWVAFDPSDYVPITRQLTINGTAFDLSADRSWTIGGTDKYVLLGNSSNTIQSDAGFQYDITTDRVFINGGLDIGNISSLYDFHASDDNQVEIVADASSAQKVFIGGRSFTGTIATPAATGANQLMVEFGAGGHTGSAFTASSTAMMRIYSTEAFTPTANGTQLRWYVTANGALSQTRAMTLDQNARLGIGVNSPSEKLDVDGNINISSGSSYKINGSDITTTNVVEGSNQYFTDERVDDRVDALVVDGTNITTSYDDGANTLTINSSYKTIIGGQPATTVGASTTTYAPIFGQTTFNATEANRQMIMPFYGTASNLYVRITGAQSGTGSLVVTVIKNGVATTLTCTIAAGSGTGTFSDTSNSFTFVAGDRITVQFKNNATATSTSIPCFSFMVH